MAAILKNRKRATSRQWFDWSARNLARWRILALWMVRQLKFRTSENSKWWTAAIVKHEQTAISRQRFDWSARDLALPLWTVLAVKFQTFKVHDGRRWPSRKIQKWPYLRYVLTDWHEIWHGDAHWLFELY